MIVSDVYSLVSPLLEHLEPTLDRLTLIFLAANNFIQNPAVKISTFSYFSSACKIPVDVYYLATNSGAKENSNLRKYGQYLLIAADIAGTCVFLKDVNLLDLGRLVLTQFAAEPPSMLFGAITKSAAPALYITGFSLISISACLTWQKSESAIEKKQALLDLIGATAQVALAALFLLNVSLLPAVLSLGILAASFSTISFIHRQQNLDKLSL